MPRTVTKLQINGKQWRLVHLEDVSTEDQAGLCEDDKRLITIWHHHSRIDLADTLIHELIHARLPDVNEDAVLETATLIRDALIKFGLLK